MCHACHAFQRRLRGHLPKYKHAKNVSISHSYLLKCQRANNRPNVPTSQRRANFLTWRANVPNSCQFFNLVEQHVKRRANCSAPNYKMLANFSTISKKFFLFLSFSIMHNICKFQEYLDNSRKFIWRNKEFRF